VTEVDPFGYDLEVDVCTLCRGWEFAVLTFCILTLYLFFSHIFLPIKNEKKKKLLKNGGTNIITLIGNTEEIDVKLSKLTSSLSLTKLMFVIDIIYHKLNIGGPFTMIELRVVYNLGRLFEIEWYWSHNTSSNNVSPLKMRHI